MRCPHCEYEDGWNGDATVQGTEGEFYRLPVELKKQIDLFPYSKSAQLYACPNCFKTFIEE